MGGATRRCQRKGLSEVHGTCPPSATSAGDSAPRFKSNSPPSEGSLVNHPDISQVSLDHPDVTVDPYPIYRRLQTEDPVHWYAPQNVWVISRYTDVVAGLLNPRLSSQPDASSLERLPPEIQAETLPLRRHFESWMLLSDPPRHGRLRRVVTAPLVAQLHARVGSPIARAAEDLLDRAEKAGTIDGLEGYSMRLARVALANVIGIEEAELDVAARWADELLEFMMIDAGAERTRQALGTLGEVTEFVGRLCSIDRPVPGSLAAAIRRAVLAHSLGEDEAVATVTQTITGSLGALSHFIANGLLALLERPAELFRLRSNPLLLRTGIEELLRFDCPFLLLPRKAREDMEIRKTRIQAEQRLWFLLGAANRDTEQFGNGEGLDVSRQPNRHLAFGAGNHSCPGATLARLVTQVAISSILRRFSRIELCRPVERLGRLGMRGVKSLPLAVAR